MKLSTILAPLIAARIPHDQILEVVRAFEEEQDNALERRRASDAARQSRKRIADKSRDVTLRHSDRFLAGASVTRVEDKPLTKIIEPKQDIIDTKGRDLAEFVAELAPQTDVARVQAIVKHRRAKKAQITGHSARLFLANVARCGISVSEAIDTCISRNWITVEPDWLKPKQRGSPPTGPKPNSIQAEIERRRELRNANRETGNDAGPPILLLRDNSGG